MCAHLPHSSKSLILTVRLFPSAKTAAIPNSIPLIRFSVRYGFIIRLQDPSAPITGSPAASIILFSNWMHNPRRSSGRRILLAGPTPTIAPFSTAFGFHPGTAFWFFFLVYWRIVRAPNCASELTENRRMPSKCSIEFQLKAILMWDLCGPWMAGAAWRQDDARWSLCERNQRGQSQKISKFSKAFYWSAISAVRFGIAERSD